MSTGRLIGLTGKAGAGKDTLAGGLAEYGFIRVGFADALKEAALATDPYVDDLGHGGRGGFYKIRLAQLVHLEGWDEAKKSPEVRRYLQTFGVAMRTARPGIWIDIAGGRIDEALTAGTDVVVTDVRFPDEVEAIRERGGHLVRVERENRQNLGANSGHVSETAVDDITPDYIFQNNGPLEEIPARLALMLMTFDRWRLA